MIGQFCSRSGAELALKGPYRSLGMLSRERGVAMAAIFRRVSVSSVVQIGAAGREARKREGLSQTELAARCSVGRRFVSELESGKPSAHLGKAIDVLDGLGLALILAAGAPQMPPASPPPLARPGRP